MGGIQLNQLAVSNNLRKVQELTRVSFAGGEAVSPEQWLVAVSLNWRIQRIDRVGTVLSVQYERAQFLKENQE